MLSHTFPANGRTASVPTLTPEEAFELAEEGFRFSVFRPGPGEFRLSLPIRVIEDRAEGTLTFEQEELRQAGRPTAEPRDLIDTI